MARRNVIFSLLVLPIVIWFLLIGWAFFWIDSQRKSDKPKKAATLSNLKFFVPTTEEKQEAKDKY